MLIIAGGSDLWEMFSAGLVIIPVIGWVLPVITIVISLFVWGILLIWFIMKGMSLGVLMVGGIVDLIPFVNVLPAKTIAVIRAIVAYSEIAEDVFKVVEKIPLPQAQAASKAMKLAKTAGKVAGKV